LRVGYITQYKLKDERINYLLTSQQHSKKNMYKKLVKFVSVLRKLVVIHAKKNNATSFRIWIRLKLSWQLWMSVLTLSKLLTQYPAKWSNCTRENNDLLIMDQLEGYY